MLIPRSSFQSRPRVPSQNNSNMADDIVQAGEQELQEFFDAAVNVARQAGKVLKYIFLMFC